MINKELEIDNDYLVLSQIQSPTLASTIKDQQTLKRLLQKGLEFNPMENYVQALICVKEKVVTSIWESKVSHGGKGEPYEFLPFTSVPVEFELVLKQCRSAGFGKPVIEGSYTYKIISGGLMRRPK